jgi:hypothetical protein
MSRIEDLAENYGYHVNAPWPRTTSGAQRVMMAVYDKDMERTLRARIRLFEQATIAAGHLWQLVDCTKWFAEWMAADEYRDAYFEEPDLLGMKLDGEFRGIVVELLSEELRAAGENTVVALLGVASLYGFTRVSELVRDVEQVIHGRLLVLFPGTKSENNYRLLDARDGWNYLAHGITAHGGDHA